MSQLLRYVGMSTRLIHQRECLRRNLTRIGEEVPEIIDNNDSNDGNSLSRQICHDATTTLIKNRFVIELLTTATIKIGCHETTAKLITQSIN